MAGMGVPLERFWKTINPLTRPLAGYVPWWVLLETTGRRTGTRRRSPLASGPLRGSELSLLSVYGDSSAFVRNIRANPRVRVKRRGRWIDGRADVVAASPEALAQLGLYARHVLIRIGSDPKVVRLTID